MKNNPLFSLQKLVISFLCCLQLQASANEAPSKTDTTSWLVQKLVNYTASFDGTSPVGLEYSHQAKVTKLDIGEDGTLQIKTIEDNTNGTHVSQLVSQMNVSLRDLYARCEVKPWDRAGYHITPQRYDLILEVSRGQGVGVSTAFGGCELPSDPILRPQIPSFEKRFVIQFADQQLAERVAKAFEHLIRLSGGSAEPF